jgi:hypothetical protein
MNMPTPPSTPPRAATSVSHTRTSVSGDHSLPVNDEANSRIHESETGLRRRSQGSASASAAPRRSLVNLAASAAHAVVQHPVTQAVIDNPLMNSQLVRWLPIHGRTVVNSLPMDQVSGLIRSIPEQMQNLVSNSRTAAANQRRQNLQNALDALDALRPAATQREVDIAQKTAADALQAWSVEARSLKDVMLSTLHNASMFGIANTGTTFTAMHAGRALGEIIYKKRAGDPIHWGLGPHPDEPLNRKIINLAMAKWGMGALLGGFGSLLGAHVVKGQIDKIPRQQVHVNHSAVYTNAKLDKMNTFEKGWADEALGALATTQKNVEGSLSQIDINIRRAVFTVGKVTQGSAQPLEPLGISGTFLTNAGVSVLSGLGVGGLQAINKTFATVEVPTDASLDAALMRKEQGLPVSRQDIETTSVAVMYTRDTNAENIHNPEGVVAGRARSQNKLLDPLPTHHDGSNLTTWHATTRTLSTAINALHSGAYRGVRLGWARTAALVLDVAGPAVAAIPDLSDDEKKAVLTTANTLATYFEMKVWVRSGRLDIPKNETVIQEDRQKMVNKAAERTAASAEATEPHAKTKKIGVRQESASVEAVDEAVDLESGAATPPSNDSTDDNTNSTNSWYDAKSNPTSGSAHSVAGAVTSAAGSVQSPGDAARHASDSEESSFNTVPSTFINSSSAQTI